MTGKSVGWVADQSVGPIVRMITGSNPSKLLTIVVPKSGYIKNAGDMATTFGNHWKHPVENLKNLLITGEGKDGLIRSVFSNVMVA